MKIVPYTRQLGGARIKCIYRLGSIVPFFKHKGNKKVTLDNWKLGIFLNTKNYIEFLSCFRTLVLVGHVHRLHWIHKKNKCFDRSMEVKLPALLGNYDRQTNRPTTRRTDRRAHWKSLNIARNGQPLSLWKLCGAWNFLRALYHIFFNVVCMRPCFQVLQSHSIHTLKSENPQKIRKVCTWSLIKSYKHNSSHIYFFTLQAWNMYKWHNKY